uniref:Uncharacterized protein n=1 Tax=Nelumbo nucifera TaxID=4432 RepID=A0A822YC17_NELNU|nr:TPA_asm: hypothetical protein HUJ06_031465 [Nelumbo nucifera]
MSSSILRIPDSRLDTSHLQTAGLRVQLHGYLPFNSLKLQPLLVPTAMYSRETLIGCINQHLDGIPSKRKLNDYGPCGDDFFDLVVSARMKKDEIDAVYSSRVEESRLSHSLKGNDDSGDAGNGVSHALSEPCSSSLSVGELQPVSELKPGFIPSRACDNNRHNSGHRKALSIRGRG